MLHQEASNCLINAIEIEDRLKMANYIQLIPAYAFLALTSYLMKNFEDAPSKALKALELTEKTSSTFYTGFVYANLVMEYTTLGDMASAEKFYEKLVNMPQAVLLSGYNRVLLGITKAMYHAAESKFDESERYFNSFFESIKTGRYRFKSSPDPNWIGFHRDTYAWCLTRQGRIEEAKIQVEQAQKLLNSQIEKFSHVHVVAGLMTRTTPTVNQVFDIRLDIVNVSRSQGSIVKVEDLLLPNLEIVDFPADCAMRDGSIEFKDGTIEPFEVKAIKLTVKAKKLEAFRLNPTVTYINDLGETKTSSTRSFPITVQAATPKSKIPPGRVSTGSAELDTLLFGGIPEKYAVALTSSSNDEKEILVERFLEAGTNLNETTVYFAVDAGGAKALVEQQPSNFYLFICNPRVDAVIESFPNVLKFKGVENLTEIDIALAKVFHKFDQSEPAPRRACIDIVSDVLLLHHPVTTRKWLGGLLADLRAKGFTTLATINPKMHPSEEVEALLGLFEGEISMSERETAEGSEKVLRVKKLSGQKYSEKEIVLSREKMML